MAEKSVSRAVKQKTAPPARSEPVQAGTQFESLLALQKTAGNRAVIQLLSQSPGQPLDASTRRWMEARFQADLSVVRVHTGEQTAQAAQDLGARAFTFDQEIVFSTGRYAPFTPTGKRLLAHELAHTIQNRHQGRPGASPLVSSPDSPAELEAGAAAENLFHHWSLPAVSAPSAGLLQFSPEKDLVKKHTSWNFLSEENLGAELLSLALQGNYEITHKVLDYLNTTDRDDVSEAFVIPATTEQLDQLAKSDQGRRLLDRVYDELTSGSIDSDEQKQADRIIAAKTRQISPEDFLKGKEKAKIFPYRKSGLTVLNDAPITASLAGKGKVYVKIPVRVLGYDKYRQDTKTLPTAAFTSGIELPENEIVGVRLYDEGGKVVYYPALYLVQIGNKSTADVAKTMGEAAALGLTFGSGALIGAGAKGATWGARALLYADRAATVLGAVTSVINDHRGWFIERFGDDGREFVEAMDTVNSVVAIYGIGRVVLGMGKLVNGLRKSYQNWRKAAKDVEKSLDNVETKRVNQVDKDTQDFLKQVEQAEAAQKAESAAGAAVKTQAPAPEAALKSQPVAEAPAPKATEKPKVEAPSKPAEPAQPKPAQAVKPPEAETEAAKTAAQKAPTAKRTPEEEYEDFLKMVEEEGGEVSVPRVKGGKIDNKRVPGRPQPKLDVEKVPARKGETQLQAVARVQRIIGKKLSDYPLLQKLWNDARDTVLKKEILTKDNYEELFNRTREAFYRRVRKDAAAKQLFKNAGFELPIGETTAPKLSGVSSDIPVEETRISLDHVAEKAQGDNWKKALDADNLRIEFARPNTEREIKQMRHPELR